jgi:hypothetical protein
MADEARLDLNIQTSANPAEVKKLDDALKATAASAESVGTAGGKAGDDLENAFASAKARIEAAQERIANSGEAGGDAASSMADGIKRKFEGVDWGDLLGKTAAVTAAATTGWEIGQTLSDAIDRVRANGLSWQAIIGPDAAADAADAAAGALAVSFSRIRQDHEDLVRTIERGPAEDSADWLRELDTNARRAADSLRALHAIESAANKAAASAINERHANQVDEIEGSDMSDADKATARSRADAERETALFQQREAERQAEVSRRAAAANAARQNRVDTESIAAEQERRARLAAEADQAAAAMAAQYDNPEAKASQGQAARENFLNARGVSPDELDSGPKEAQKLEAARAAAARAAEASRRAALERDSAAASAQIESAADRNATLGRTRRGLNQASRQAEEYNVRDEQRAAREQEREARSGGGGGGDKGAAEMKGAEAATREAAKSADSGNAAVVQFAQTATAEMERLKQSHEATLQKLKLLESQMKNARK